MNNEIEILPHIMIILLMEVKALICIPIELLFINIANEAQVLHIFFASTPLISQLSKCINNNTKNDIEQNCNNQQEKREVHYRPEIESLQVLSSCCLRWQKLSNTSSTSYTIIDGRQEAVHHGHTNAVSLHVEVAVVHVIVVVGFINENETDGGVNVDDD